MSKKLKYRMVKQADWEAKQHAEHLSHKLKFKDLGKGGEKNTEKMVHDAASDRFKDVITSRFEWFWEDEGKESKKDSGEPEGGTAGTDKPDSKKTGTKKSGKKK